jgi:uncharacterized protein
MYVKAYLWPVRTVGAGATAPTGLCDLAALGTDEMAPAGGVTGRVAFLLAESTDEERSDPGVAPGGGEDPLPHLERWAVPDVLDVVTGELGHPVTFLVLVKPRDRPLHPFSVGGRPCPAGHDGSMVQPLVAGLVLTPGASAGRDQSGLVAVDRAVTETGVTVERVEFPGRTAGKRRPDPPEVCIATIRAATETLGDRLGVPTARVAIGGRSMGGRMCSLAAAEGLAVAALVLISYPLHPPGRPEKLRTAHFPDLTVPCLFVSGRKDPFGAPGEIETETAAIAGPTTLAFVDGDHSLRRSETEAADAVASWLTDLGPVRRR